MLVKELRHLISLTEEIRDAARGRPLLTIPFGGELAGLADMPTPPHDYETFVAKAPERCRVVRVIVGSDIALRFNVRHALFGPDRIAQFHGGELPGLMFIETANVTLAWNTVLEKDDPIEINVSPTTNSPTTVRGVLLALPTPVVASVVSLSSHGKDKKERWEARAKGHKR